MASETSSNLKAMKQMLEEKRNRIAAGAGAGGEDGEGMGNIKGNIKVDEKGIPVAEETVGLLDTEKAKGLLGNTIISKFKATATAG